MSKLTRHTSFQHVKVLLLGAAGLLITGCSLIVYNNIEYNNRVAEHVNLSASAIEESAARYNSDVPSTVSEQDEIDVTQLKESYREAVQEMNNITRALNIESKDKGQEEAVQTALESYELAANLYLEEFNAMLTYYEDGLYKEDLSLVVSYDEELHKLFTRFIEANNSLVEVLAVFVSEEDEPAQ